MSWRAAYWNDSTLLHPLKLRLLVAPTHVVSEPSANVLFVQPTLVGFHRKVLRPAMYSEDSSRPWTRWAMYCAIHTLSRVWLYIYSILIFFQRVESYKSERPQKYPGASQTHHPINTVHRHHFTHHLRHLRAVPNGQKKKFISAKCGWTRINTEQQLFFIQTWFFACLERALAGGRCTKNDKPAYRGGRWCAKNRTHPKWGYFRWCDKNGEPA